jgi:uncharacterized protein YjbI with pentapeptide repeats
MLSRDKTTNYKMNIDHLHILMQGHEVWENWRNKDPAIEPDLSSANLVHAQFFDWNFSHTNLSGANFAGATLIQSNFAGANLLGARLYRANLYKANLQGAILNRANLDETILADANIGNASLIGTRMMMANLIRANLSGSDLHEAWLSGSTFSYADLTNTNLTKSQLDHAILTNCNLSFANLTGSIVYGVAAWDVNTDETTEQDLIISQYGSPQITVDSIEIAQFIYLILNNIKIRNVIDRITSRVVLILGSFINERKLILDTIREELRKHNYIPILFDFEMPFSRDSAETVLLLAHMARFIIADLTSAKSVLLELQKIVPSLPSVPVQPIIAVNDSEPGMIDHLNQYPWFLQSFVYNDK